tara:strand:+ start:152 stop:574 length:423 start_codon:yes stop_codon:yes gene_type:complete
MSDAAKSTMALTEQRVRELFSFLEEGQGDQFFEAVSDDVDWLVMPTHPTSGHYHTKEDFLNHTIRRVSKLVHGSLKLRVSNILISGDWSIVELHSTAMDNNDKPFTNCYCWLLRWENNKIVQVKAYQDSYVATKLIEENE